MDKTFIRLSIIIIALYLILCYLLPFLSDKDIWSQWYFILFEVCVCISISKHGVFHCKYLKYTAYGILISDTLICIDNSFDIIPNALMVFLPLLIISGSLLTTTTLAIRHFIRVLIINFKRNEQSSQRPTKRQ